MDVRALRFEHALHLLEPTQEGRIDEDVGHGAPMNI